MTHGQNPTGLKRCTKCGELKPSTAEYFHRASDQRSGLRPDCKECVKIKQRQYNMSERAENWQKNNPEKYKEYQRQYAREHLEKHQRYYAEHLDQMREYGRRYNREHAERKRENDRRWRAEHPEEVRAGAHKSRLHRMAAIGSYTAEDVRIQKRAQTDKKGRLICWWCDKPIDGTYHVDHRVPLDKGGTNWPENIVITHAFCNLSKHNKLPGEFNGRLL